MEIPGAFAIIGLLTLALHVARPGLLKHLVHADTRMWGFLPWVTEAVLDPEGSYQRYHRRVTVVAIVGWTMVNLAIFTAAYA